MVVEMNLPFWCAGIAPLHAQSPALRINFRMDGLVPQSASESHPSALESHCTMGSSLEFA
jgi:hypothetical protein